MNARLEKFVANMETVGVERSVAICRARQMAEEEINIRVHKIFREFYKDLHQASFAELEEIQQQTEKGGKA